MKPYDRTRNSKQDENDLIGERISYKAAVRQKGDIDVDSDGNDLGYYKRSEYNEKTKRLN